MFKIRNPKAIRFIHQTISPSLSKPKPGEVKVPHLDALANDIASGVQNMLDFPPINIFSIRDPETKEKHYYSLNNRKLYLAKKSRSENIGTTHASFSEILDSLWKMTSSSDGLAFPIPTRNGDKECNPTGLLLQFRNFLALRKELYSLNTPKNASETVEARLLREAQETFRLKCQP